MIDPKEDRETGLRGRAKAYAVFLAVTVVVSYVAKKTGYYYSRHVGLHREHAPKEWGEALRAIVEEVPWLLVLFVLIVGATEVYKWIRRVAPHHGVSIRSVRSTLRRWFAPRYDEVTLFVMSVAFVLLVLSDEALRAHSVAVASNVQTLRDMVVPGLFLGGLSLSLFHAFAERRKTGWERTSMLFFAIGLHFGSGLIAAEHLLEASSGRVHWIFPVWNVLNWTILFLLWRFDVLEPDDSIAKNDASRIQVLIALGAAFGLVLVGQYVAHYHWTLTLSMTVAVASTVGHGIERVGSFGVRRTAGRTDGGPMG